MKTLLRIGLATAMATVFALVAGPAQAWDPSTTHLGIVDRAAIDSGLHVRWMDDSGLQRGLFTSLRVDPRRLSPAERRMLTLALRAVHADSGAAGLGGPGACPGADAPPSTQVRCVSGDLWELTALGWLRLGVLAELTPRERLVHHFVDAKQPTATVWRDRDLAPGVIRTRGTRSNGSALAGTWTRTGFGGRGPSAAAWLTDADDLLAPPRLFEHLERAATDPDPAVRDHHRALGLLCVGALLHVAADLTTPAHARGDLAAFFAPLSDARGDRGLPLQEFARMQFGRSGLPKALDLAQRPDEQDVVAGSIRGHLFGAGGFEGVVSFAGRRFLSESSVPGPTTVDRSLSPEAAAKVVLRRARLGASTIKGATLGPWPSDRGYVRTATGRALAAFEHDADGRLRLFLDRTVYRSQSLHLIPAAVAMSRSLLAHLWPAWPEAVVDRGADVIELRLNDKLEAPELLVFIESGDGARTLRQRVRLRAGQNNRVTGALPATLPKGSRVVLVVLGGRADGERLVLERTLVDEAKPDPAESGSGPTVKAKVPAALEGTPDREATETDPDPKPEPDPKPDPKQPAPDSTAPAAQGAPDSKAPPPKPS